MIKIPNCSCCNKEYKNFGIYFEKHTKQCIKDKRELFERYKKFITITWNNGNNEIKTIIKNLPYSNLDSLRLIRSFLTDYIIILSLFKRYKLPEYKNIKSIINF